MPTLRNPVLCGFHPDPSACVVQEDIYMVASSFAWFPGVPIYHSRDLVHWRQIGNILDRPSQLALAKASIGGGIWAPTIRHHDGRFWMTTTNRENGGNFLVHSTHPEGPWSDPIWIDLPGWDPSLDWSPDGVCYFSCARDGTVIHAATLDPINGRLTSPVRELWAGSGGFGVEAPHLYFRNGWVYLMVAEGGGWHRGHMVAIARSRSPWGPFEAGPRNPVLSQRDRLADVIQATGHGDLFQTADGRWWICYLGLRNYGGLGDELHPLGREAFLSPVQWDNDGWPVVTPPTLAMAAPTGSPHPWPETPLRDNFDEAALGAAWLSLRGPASCNLRERPGWLRLSGPARLAQRQTQPWSRTRCRLEPVRGEGGFSIFVSEQAHTDVLWRNESIVVERRFDDWVEETVRVPAPAGPVEMEILSNPWAYLVRVLHEDREIARYKQQSRLLSSDLTAHCTGATLGFVAAEGAILDVDWFEHATWRDGQDCPLRF